MPTYFIVYKVKGIHTDVAIKSVRSGYQSTLSSILLFSKENINSCYAQKLMPRNTTAVQDIHPARCTRR
jgi:hypothetical protein